MWIDKSKWVSLEHHNSKLSDEVKHLQWVHHEQVLGLERMNARLQADLDWFKHRLNQVEQERGQLIQAALGMKISIPQFVTTHDDPGAALHEMPDLRSIGEDALDQGMQTEAEPAEGVDYALMPGYKAKR